MFLSQTLVKTLVNNLIKNIANDLAKRYQYIQCIHYAISIVYASYSTCNTCKISCTLRRWCIYACYMHVYHCTDYQYSRHTVCAIFPWYRLWAHPRWHAIQMHSADAVQLSIIYITARMGYRSAVTVKGAVTDMHNTHLYMHTDSMTIVNKTYARREGYDATWHYNTGPVCACWIHLDRCVLDWFLLCTVTISSAFCQ